MRVKITFDHGLTYIRDSDTGKMLCSILAFELSMDSRRPGESTVKVVTDTPLPTEEYEELEGEIEATVTGQTVLGVSLLEDETRCGTTPMHILNRLQSAWRTTLPMISKNRG